MSETEQTIDEQIEALVSGSLEGDEIEHEEAEEVTSENLDTDQETEVVETQEEEEEEAEEEAPEIDYDQEIPMPDGRDTMTLSALKDRVIELERTEDQFIGRENDLMRRTDELTDALAMAGGEIPPQLKQKMHANQKARLDSEHAKMLEAMPGWKDPATFKAAREGIVNVGNKYGLTEKEIGGISDHRVIKFMHDHARLLAKFDKGATDLKRLKPVPKKKGKTAAISTGKSRLNKQVDDAINHGGDKYAAIDALLKTG